MFRSSLAFTETGKHMLDNQYAMEQILQKMKLISFKLQVYTDLGNTPPLRIYVRQMTYTFMHAPTNINTE